MAFMGGDSQSTGSVVSSIDFSPILNFGDGNEAIQDKTFEQTASTSPRLDGSLGVSASVGVGGNGGTATTSRQQSESAIDELERVTGINQNTLYVIGGVLVLGVVYFFKKRK